MGYQSHLATCLVLLAICTGSVSAAEDMPTWKLIAIIVPSVVGGLTLITVFFYCCCCSTRGGSGSNHWCGGCENDCTHCYGCEGDCCGCCNSRPHVTQQTVYSSAQGPIQVQPVQKYRSPPCPQAIGYNDPTYAANLPVSSSPYGGGVYGVGRPGPSYGGPVYGGAPRQQSW